MSDLAKQFLMKFKRFTKEDISLVLENTQVESFKKGELIWKKVLSAISVI